MRNKFFFGVVIFLFGLFVFYFGLVRIPFFSMVNQPVSYEASSHEPSTLWPREVVRGRQGES